MEFIRFNIKKYKAIKDASIKLTNQPIPIIGVNESGKSSILEAIASFDFRNEDISREKGWEFMNRYLPDENDFEVEAEVAINDAELNEILDGLPEDHRDEFTETIKIDPNTSCIKISRFFRNISEKRYQINGNESNEINEFCTNLIQKLPRIVYFENFLENPFPDEIEIPGDYLNEQYVSDDPNLKIVEKMFADKDLTLKDVLKAEVAESKDTFFNRVGTYVTEALTEDWRKMHARNDDPDIEKLGEGLDIDLKYENNKIRITITEEFDNNGCKEKAVFKLKERSLGFRWYFNFSIIKNFANNGEEKFIYLIDEPGSYLHHTAQKILLDALIELANDNKIIFSTHSEFLIDPEKINISNIQIVEKPDKAGKITLTPYSSAQRTKKTEGAFSTLDYALRTKISLHSTLNKNVVITEGITDFYFWKIFLKDIVILPGIGAGSNEYLISLAIGTAKHYIALFDGDDQGDNAIDKYKKFFLQDESINWKEYIDELGNKVTLERIFTDNDRNKLLAKFNVPDFKKGITLLYFDSSTNEKETQDFLQKLETKTKANIRKNLRIIGEHLKIRKKDDFVKTFWLKYY